MRGARALGDDAGDAAQQPALLHAPPHFHDSLCAGHLLNTNKNAGVSLLLFLPLPGP